MPHFFISRIFYGLSKKSIETLLLKLLSFSAALESAMEETMTSGDMLAAGGQGASLASLPLSCDWCPW